jgi:hypothetical protein
MKIKLCRPKNKNNDSKNHMNIDNSWRKEQLFDKQNRIGEANW